MIKNTSARQPGQTLKNQVQENLEIEQIGPKWCSRSPPGSILGLETSICEGPGGGRSLLVIFGKPENQFVFASKRRRVRQRNEVWGLEREGHREEEG